MDTTKDFKPMIKIIVELKKFVGRAVSALRRTGMIVDLFFADFDVFLVQSCAKYVVLCNCLNCQHWSHIVYPKNSLKLYCDWDPANIEQPLLKI